MSQTTSPAFVAAHLRSGRYAQRERPAASIPDRLRAGRLTAATPPGKMSAGPAIAFLASLFGAQ
jgi:hypothetical protein